MRIGRTLPPAAAPLGFADLGHGLAGLCAPDRARRAREAELRQHFGVRHVWLVSSGTAALVIALRALRSRSGRSEVVIPAYTCFSVPAAVVAAGLRPVLCDIDAGTFDFDRAELARLVGPRTLCVVAHHLFGIPADVDGIRSLCAPRGVFVVEDAAQAMGVTAGGRPLGTLGDVGIFSLGRGKNVTCGSGGVVLTSDEAIAAAVRSQCERMPAPTALDSLKDLAAAALLALFVRPRLFWIPAALPFLKLGRTLYPREIPLAGLSGTKAGLLRKWRRRLAWSNGVRSRTAAALGEALHLAPAQEPVPYLRVPVLAASAAERKRIQALGQSRGLGISPAYPTPVHEIQELKHAFAGQHFPSAQRVAERLLTLPTHHWLERRDVAAIADCVGVTVPAVRHDAWRKAG
jgi:dTDP-4-amino-4,6-dideoxygalactose transaminase